MKGFIYMLLVFFIISCNGDKMESVENFISKVENEDLSVIDNITAHYRSRDGVFKKIYVVSRTNENCRPLVVTYNHFNNKIESVSKKLIKDDSLNNECYIKPDQLNSVMNKIQEYKLYSITIDSIGSFFGVEDIESVNVIAQLIDSKKESLRIRGKDYEKVNGNWYVSPQLPQE